MVKLPPVHRTRVGPIRIGYRTAAALGELTQIGVIVSKQSTPIRNPGRGVARSAQAISLALQAGKGRTAEGVVGPGNSV